MPARRSHHSEFDKLLAEIDSEDTSRAELESARRWVAEKLYDVPTLASLRLKAGLSQRELGARCNLEQEHVSRYESGRVEPGLVVAGELAKALGVSLDEFNEAWRSARARADAVNKRAAGQ